MKKITTLKKYSQWSSPTVLEPKKNKDWRLYVDYRKLNDLTIKDSYTLPLIDDILSLAGDNIKFLSTIDLYSRYHQIPMDRADKDKTVLLLCSAATTSVLCPMVFVMPKKLFKER